MSLPDTKKSLIIVLFTAGLVYRYDATLPRSMNGFNSRTPLSMSDCIFCKIVRREIPAYVVYEDDQVLAFLNIHPIRPGHTLVIPKIHEPELYKLSPEHYQAVMAVSQRVSQHIADQLSPKKIGLMVMGWDVPHAHVHVVPIKETGDITSSAFLEGVPPSPAPEELARIAELLK